MKTYLLIIFTFVFINVNAQNLVPNSSFENNTGCPSQIGQVDKADGWVNWGVTPDYFNACSNSTFPLYGVPQNTRGFQAAHFGQAYMGIFTYSDLLANFREFIGRPMSQPMVPGQAYFISFWVCNVEQLLSTHSSNNIGVRFTTSSDIIWWNNPDTALNNAHVFSPAVINDTANWIQVSGTFIADSAYTHIGIGNYFDDAATTLVTGDPSSNYAYYLIDDVCVSIDPQFCNIETMISENPDGQFEIHPNPASQSITISSENLFNGEVLIYNVTGNIVSSFSHTSTGSLKFNFDTSGLVGGVYYIKMTGVDFSDTEKFIVIGDR